MTMEVEINSALDPLIRAFNEKLSLELEGHATETYLSGSAEMVEWGKTQRGLPIVYEGPPMEEAVEYAKKRGAKLVTNMDKETKRRLARVISNGIKNKRGVQGISRDLRSEFKDMSMYRSKLIARTETADALSQASLKSMEEMGIEGKEWITAGDDKVSDECRRNGKEGIIPRDQAFSSGAMAPPQHPNCRCALAPARLKKE